MPGFVCRLVRRATAKTVHREGVLTLSAADWLGVDAAGGNQNYTFPAYNIWLIAQKVGTVSLQTI